MLILGLFCVDENVLVEIVVRWERGFFTWMFMLELFGVDENAFGGTLGQVGTGLFNL